jgi:hypothetical protein
MTTPKPKADEIKGRLVAWQQTPESQRPSLRALAAGMGVSHQLLSHHLKGLDDWRIKQRKLELDRQSAAIRERAQNENRPLTADEDAQLRAIFMEHLRVVTDPLAWKAIERAAPSNKRIAKFVLSRARRGDPRAQEIVDKLHLGQAPSVKRAKRVW